MNVLFNSNRLSELLNNLQLMLLQVKLHLKALNFAMKV